MILVDTSLLYAGFVADEPWHEQVVRTISEIGDTLVVSPLVLTELDYLVTTRHGVTAELSLMRSVAGGAFDLAPLGWYDVRAALDLVERYRHLGIGLTDASIAVLAERLGTQRILTLDRRHFGTLRTSRGEPFELLP